MQQKVNILNVDIDNLTEHELLERFTDGLLVTPNVDHLIKLQKDKEFYNCYMQAKYTVCDSRILFLLSKILNPETPLKSQITGSDFFPRFCSYHSNSNSEVKIFLLGGTTNSVIKAQNNINRKTQSNIVTQSYSPPFGFDKSEQENTKIINLINSSGANTLAVGVGAPKQEKWICENRSRLPKIKRFLAIGATIEFESGDLTRAPKWMTKLGLEWLFRITQDPKRLIKRYLFDDIPVFILLAKQKFGRYQNPWK